VRTAIFIVPQRYGSKELLFLAAIAEDQEAIDPEEDIVDLDRLLPDPWHGKFTEHFIPKDLFSDTFKLEEPHDGLALLESDQGEADPMYFGPRQAVRHCGVVLWKQGNTYRSFHCKQCAVQVLSWLNMEQEAWSKKLN
jgi:hypothetical protein